MFRNLIGIAESGEDYERLLSYLDTQVILQPASIEYRAKRIDVNARTGRVDDAIADIDWIIEREPEGADLQKLKQYRDLIARQKNGE